MRCYKKLLKHIMIAISVHKCNPIENTPERHHGYLGFFCALLGKFGCCVAMEMHYLLLLEYDCFVWPCFRHCSNVGLISGGCVLQHHHGLDLVVSLQLLPRPSALEPVSTQSEQDRYPNYIYINHTQSITTGRQRFPSCGPGHPCPL